MKRRERDETARKQREAELDEAARRQREAELNMNKRGSHEAARKQREAELNRGMTRIMEFGGARGSNNTLPTQ